MIEYVTVALDTATLCRETRMLGRSVGNYELVAKIGEGGMGTVYLAEHKALGRLVAVKVLHADLSANAEIAARFHNEARAATAIRHPGVVEVYDIGVLDEHRAYIVMEFLDGESLAARIARGRCSLAATLAILRAIARALQAAHELAIVHRDLKPENVFLVHDREHASGERVKLLDFGIAKLSDAIASANPTTVGAMGTPTYMAPEQWSDSSRVDWRADVYSLGCLLYKMAAGRPPFSTHSIAEACAKHLHETPQTMRAHAPDVPVALDALALRLLAKAPDARAPSIEALEGELAEIAHDLAGTPLPPGRPSAPSLADAAAPTALTTGELTAVQTPTQAQMTSTTLSSAASSAVPPTLIGKRTRLIMPVALALGGAAVVIGVLATRSDAVSPAPGPGPEPTKILPPLDASPPLDAAPASARALIDWIETANPFVDWHGAQWLAHQVTRREYHKFLEMMPVGDALRLQPVTGWNEGDPMRPVAWVTYERATAFCQAIHARLPTSEEWLAASQGDWGLDPEATGRPGPLQEWTSTESDGLVVVRGGHEKMSVADRRAAAADPLMKNSEAAAGPSSAPKLVAAETIGFRCVRYTGTR